MSFHLDFERPIVELEQKISELRELSGSQGMDLSDEVSKLEKKLERLVEDTYQKLSPWERTQLSRHPNRPYMLDYVEQLFDEFLELHGDRNFGDDPAVVGGLAKFEDRTVMVVGHQKGRTTKQKIHRNFGMPRPEGYRKALRLMSMAERLGFPIITFIDTPGAYPGIGAEERGQAEAIAKNIMVMSKLKVPVISVVLGEGGSGGALAIGVADRILMLEFSVYSVISPESCAAILWRDSAKGDLAAKALKLTAPEILKLGICDEIISEPMGGAHRNFHLTSALVKRSLSKHLKGLSSCSDDDLLSGRYKKYRKIGVYANGKA